MAKITAGAASEKINELKSKIAIYNSWEELINANYLPNDGGSPEAHVVRDDGVTAAPAHFKSVLVDLEEKRDELRNELEEWENLVFEPKVADVTPLHPDRGEQKKAPERKQPRRAQPAK